MSLPLLVNFILWPAALCALAIGAAIDLKERVIPNECALVVALCGLILSLAGGFLPAVLCLFTAALVFVGTGMLANRRLIGGGDMKLVSAVILLVPASRAGELLIEIALAGGVLSCLYLAARFALRRLAMLDATPASAPATGLVGFVIAECTRIAAGGPLPYALAILAGVCLYLSRELARCSYAIFC